MNVTTVIKDIPYAPSSEERLKIMMELAQIQPGDKAIDLGSGDGRVVIAMAKQGAEAIGVEIDSVMVEEAFKNIKKAGLDGKVMIYNNNFWDIDLKDFDVVTVYGITSIMGRLEDKLRRELKPGAKVVSNFFVFPTWDYKVKKGDVYLYVQP